ncbi:hypothetical protein RSAG8_05156, partial [Rhizoctonia solani AG-8 WAC10335]
MKGLFVISIRFDLFPPLFHLSPVTLNNTYLGWVPDCATPDCLPTASWSTSAVNSTLSFSYWGREVAFDGNVKGNMSIQLLHDGIQAPWDPSGDTLFSHQGGSNDELYLRNITLKVVHASTDAQLTVNRARVNGSTFADSFVPPDTWTVPSDDDSLKYTGFTPQASGTRAESSTVYISSRVGDTLSMKWNASAFVMYGPCGPTNGLMRVTIDSHDQQRIRQQTVNTSKPFASNDCLLFQTWSLGSTSPNQILIENLDGGMLGIARFDALKVQLSNTSRATVMRATVAACVVLGVIAVSAATIVVYVRKAVKREQEAGGPLTNHWRLKLPCLRDSSTMNHN